MKSPNSLPQTKFRAPYLLVIIFMVILLLAGPAATGLAVEPEAGALSPAKPLVDASASAGYALYATNGASHFTIDIETGAETRLGSGGFILSLTPGGEDFIYGEGRFGNVRRLYRVELVTGSSEEVGPTELAQTGSGLAFGGG